MKGGSLFRCCWQNFKSNFALRSLPVFAITFFIFFAASLNEKSYAQPVCNTTWTGQVSNVFEFDGKQTTWQAEFISINCRQEILFLLKK